MSPSESDMLRHRGSLWIVERFLSGQLLQEYDGKASETYAYSSMRTIVRLQPSSNGALPARQEPCSGGDFGLTSWSPLLQLILPDPNKIIHCTFFFTMIGLSTSPCGCRSPLEKWSTCPSPTELLLPAITWLRWRQSEDSDRLPLIAQNFYRVRRTFCDGTFSGKCVITSFKMSYMRNSRSTKVS